jgi:hypothetical protein
MTDVRGLEARLGQAVDDSLGLTHSQTHVIGFFRAAVSRMWACTSSDPVRSSVLGARRRRDGR